MKNPFRKTARIGKTYTATFKYTRETKTTSKLESNIDELPEEAKRWILRDLLLEKGIWL